MNPPGATDAMPILHLLRQDEAKGRNTYELVRGHWGNRYGYPDSVYIEADEWEDFLDYPATAYLKGYERWGQASNHRHSEWAVFRHYIEGLARRARRARSAADLAVQCADLHPYRIHLLAWSPGAPKALADSLFDLSAWLKRAVSSCGSVSVVSL